jgi:hypothetical protein
VMTFGGVPRYPPQVLVNAVTGKVDGGSQANDARRSNLGNGKDREAICSE